MHFSKKEGCATDLDISYFVLQVVEDSFDKTEYLTFFSKKFGCATNAALYGTFFLECETVSRSYSIYHIF